MKIGGIQKLTCLDFPGKVACTIFTVGCNFRCPFCHNASLVRPSGSSSQIATEEILSFLKKRQGLLDGVCITGGEPLLQKDIEAFAAEIKQLGYAVKIDTNGAFPEKLKAILDAGLVDYVAMDIKNCVAKYPETIGLVDSDITRSVVDSVLRSVDILRSGSTPYEFRTTVVKGFHDEESLRETAEWLGDVPRYFLQKFVDSGDLLAAETKGYTDEEMLRFADVVREHVPAVEVRGI